MAPAKGLIPNDAAAGVAAGTPDAAAAPAAAAAAPAAAAPGAAPELGLHRSADEASRFGAAAGTRPEYVPEKFWKEGKVDLEGAFSSYKELETRFTTKTEDLLKTLDTERRKGLPEAPDKYELKLSDDAPVSVDDLQAHPSVEWWRKTAFEMGLPPEKFNEGVSQLVGILTEGPDLEVERKALGENADVRINAVATWARATFTDPTEFAALQQLGSSAAGIAVIEKLMGRSAPMDSGDAASTPELTPAKLREMQADPRYYDRTRRDPAFVKKVDEGFQKLYAKK